MNPVSLFLHENGAWAISTLQQSFPGQGEFFMQISHIGDPSLVFTVYFPLTAALNLNKAIQLLWTVLFCEWTNMLFKWIFAGDRPYWWVNDSPLFKERRTPTLEQFRMTCETGPGMPSGHTTLNAAVFFIIVKMVLESSLVQKLSRSNRKSLQWFLWSSYLFWICLVVLSRCYIAAHFPHQCVTGVIIGILSAISIRNLRFLSSMTYRKAVLLSFFVLSSVLLVFGSYILSGGDPMWSVSKARQWCSDISYIKIDSKPFYALSRFSGVCLGVGISMATNFYQKFRQTKVTILTQLPLIVLNLSVGKSVEILHKSLPSSTPGYYLIEFLMNATMTLFIVAIIPYLVISILGFKSKKKYI